MGLWARLIISICGSHGGFGSHHPLPPRGTWSAIITAGRDIDAAGVEFENNFRRLSKEEILHFSGMTLGFVMHHCQLLTTDFMRLN